MIKQVPLPPEEQAFLRELQEDIFPDAMKIRLQRLFNAGWSLTTLGEGLSPSRPRATIHYWIKTLPPLSPTDHPVFTTPIPKPEYPNSTAVSSLLPETTATIRSVSPDVPEQFVTLLPSLALQARRYRAKMSSTSIYARANQQFTDICKELHALGVPSQKIADVAGVSYRAIARRVAK